MTENIKKFLELVSKDEDLGKSFEEASTLEGNEVKKAVTKLAQEHGITLTEEDFTEQNPGEIDEEELLAVAGGMKCGCFGNGGGEANKDSEHRCICVAVGTGKGKMYSNDAVVEYNRCICSFSGAGDAGY